LTTRRRSARRSCTRSATEQASKLRRPRNGCGPGCTRPATPTSVSSTGVSRISAHVPSGPALSCR
jgi:hypothetical protein